MPTQDLPSLVQRLSRRYTALLRWRNGTAWTGLAAGAALVLATVRAAWFERGDWTLAYGAVGALWLAGLAVFWMRARADERRLLGAADHQVAGEEQLITTYELERKEPGNPFLPLLRRRTESLMLRVDPRALIPMQLHKPALTALGFAVVAFALFLMPSEWLRVTRAAMSPGQQLLSEEGARIRRYAERMEEMARREEMPLAQALAKEAQVVGKAMEEKDLSALDASEQVEGLIRLAEELASQAAKKGKSGVTGEDQVAFESGSQTPQGAQEGGAPAGYTGGGNNQVQQENTGNISGGDDDQQSNMSNIDDPFAEKDPGADAQTAAQPEKSREMEVLERAQMQMQQAQRNIAEGNQATEDQEGIADQSARNSMDDLGRARPEEAGQEGQESASPSNSMNEAEGQNATPSDAFGQGPTSAQNERDDGKGKPKEEGYEDSQLFGMNGPAEADEKWVRQLPTLNAREIRPDGSLQDFQQAAVRAQGGSAIPRAYRAVVRSYFMHLERLNIDQELGLPEPPPVEQDITPVEVPPDPGGTFGPEYEGNAEAPPVIDGGRGPDR